MKLNTDKCHLIISGYIHELWAHVSEDKIWESADVKLLGVTIDKELKFDKQVSKICSKASRKLSVLARVSKFLTFKKKRDIFKTFVKSQLYLVCLSGCFIVVIQIIKSIDYMKEHCK